MSKKDTVVERTSGSTSIGFGFLFWLGGALFTMNQPGMNFLDGLIWLYYVGRFVAQHFTTLSY